MEWNRKKYLKEYNKNIIKKFINNIKIKLVCILYFPKLRSGEILVMRLIRYSKVYFYAEERIITKSIPRFARNILYYLNYIRKRKELGDNLSRGK